MNKFTVSMWRWPLFRKRMAVERNGKVFCVIPSGSEPLAKWICDALNVKAESRHEMIGMDYLKMLCADYDKQNPIFGEQGRAVFSFVKARVDSLQDAYRKAMQG